MPFSFLTMEDRNEGPADSQGSWEERLAATRVIRDEIRAKITAWCAEICAPVET